MLFSLLLLVPTFGLLGGATETYARVSASSHKRQMKSCEETYGNGTVPCGGSDSTWCYNPDLGQTCCHLDGGFCNSGSYCAPVAGYCCPEDVDLSTCARINGFDLPNSGLGHITTPDTSKATSTEVSRTFTVSPFLEPDSTPTPIFTLDSGADNAPGSFTALRTNVVAASSATCHEAPSFTNPVVIQISNTSASPSMRPSTPVSPVIQVSISVERNRSLVSSIIIVLVASAFAIIS
ncbi:hypothetical protein F5Y14DRAFT_269124 [Nemania sp. NC0429]|nr:hypothetical protein F5Y14DRAFT_269124 [Nemania sp. NC0429]